MINRGWMSDEEIQDQVRELRSTADLVGRVLITSGMIGLFILIIILWIIYGCK